ncbi:hypothetical protein GCM10009099_32030 [Caenispirillum bisanense]
MPKDDALRDDAVTAQPRHPAHVTFPRVGPRCLLVLLTTVFVVVTVAAWGAFLMRDRAQVLEATDQQLRLIARLVTGNTFRTVQGSDLVLRKIQSDIESRGFAAWAFEPGAWQRLNAAAGTLPQAGALFVIGADGQAVAHSTDAEAPRIFLGDRDYFVAHAKRRSDAPYVGDRIVSRIDGRDIIGISRRLNNADGSFAGVVVAAVNIDYFDRFFESLPLAPGSAITILRGDGTILLRQPHELPRHKAPHLAEGEVGLEQAVFSILPDPDDGAPMAVARQTVGSYGLVVAASRRQDQVFDAWQHRLLTGSSVVAVLVAGLSLLTVIGLRGLRRQEAMAAALRHSNEDLERRVEARTAALRTTNSALEAAVAEKSLLLHEVHHRVKNNLQMVEALLALQSSRVDEDSRQALEAARRRINALGFVHQQLLGGGDLTTLRADTFLRDLCDRLALSFGAEDRGISLAVGAEPLPLPLDLAIPIGLIVNEVLSNAFKHAFPDGRRGTISVSLGRQDGMLCLRLGDDGCGCGCQEDAAAVPVPTGRSLGHRIVQSLVKQLKGTLLVDRDGGTRLTITLPQPETPS